MVKFNINETIAVKLTDRGMRVLSENPIYNRKRPDVKGYYSFQMWSFMQVFGPYIEIGMDILFEDNNVYFKESDLEKGM